MHPALHIREIAAAIALQVDRFDKRDLASLARTCRSLSEPALDVLWKAPPAWNLALRMTRELWIVKTMTYSEVLVGDCDEESMEKVKNPDSWRMLVSPLGPRPHTRHLRHAPTLQTLSPAAESIAPQDLDLGLRFASYARRVRTLLLHESTDDMMDERGEREVSTAVYALWAARAELFPGLDDLTFARKYLSLSPANEALLLAFLRTTRLRALTIEVDRTGVELLERNRDTLLAGCSSLRRFQLGGVENRPVLEAAERWATLAGDILLRIPDIREVELGVPLRYVDFRRLSTMPMLQSLVVQNIICIPQDLPPLPSTAFARLTSLRLLDDTQGARLVPYILSFQPCACFAHCRLSVPADTDLDTARRVIAQLSAYESLRSIDVRFGKLVNVSGSAGESALLLNALKPSSRLGSLTIVSPTTLPLDLSDLERVLSSYPNLSQLDWPLPFNCTIWLSLGALMDILQHRPQIRQLPIGIGSPDVPTLEARAAFGKHGYNSLPYLEVLEEALTPELRAALEEHFPEVPMIFSV
jgi:hypothetical protein